MRKVILRLLIFLFTFGSFLVPIHADIGPKPSVNLTFVNMPEGEYYVTLLSSQDTYGPWHQITETTVQEEPNEEAARAFLKAIEGSDFYLLNYIQESSSSHSFSWGYYPPDEFVIAVYFPQTQSVLMSPRLERVAFDTYYTVSYQNDHLEIQEEFNGQAKLLNFLFRVIATIVVELLIGLLFGYRAKKERRTIFFTNLITQFLLHGLMFLFDYYLGGLVWVFVFPVLELIVFVIELIVYLITMKGHSKWKTFFYTLLANFVTLCIGIGLAILII